MNIGFEWKNASSTKQVLLEKLRVTHSKIECFLWNLKLTIIILRNWRWTLSQAGWIQSTTSYAIPLRSILILPFHLILGFFNLSFLVRVFRLKFCVHYPSLCSSCRTHLTLFDHIEQIIFSEGHKIWISSLSNLFRPSIASFIFLSALLSENSIYLYTSSLMWYTKFHIRPKQFERL
jgi:hypothetical protein